MTKESDYATRLRGWIGHPACPAQAVQDDLRAGADEIERLQKRLRVARNIIVDAQNFIHPTTVWRDTDLMQRNIDRFLADGRTSEPGATPPEMRFSPVLERASTQPHGWVADMEQDPNGMWTPAKSGEQHGG